MSDVQFHDLCQLVAMLGFFAVSAFLLWLIFRIDR